MLNNKQFTLKQLRGLSGLSQEELGKAVQLTARTIGTYENDIDSFKKVSYTKLQEIAKVLNVSVDNIFLG